MIAIALHRGKPVSVLICHPIWKKPPNIKETTTNGTVLFASSRNQ